MKKKTIRGIKEATTTTRRRVHEAEGGLGGALTGAAVGVIAGPPGAIAGAIIGGVIGALTVSAVEQDLGDRALRERRLDAEIGVTGGTLGAPNLLHPAATRGVYSGESAGSAGSHGSDPAEGPMQTPGT